MTVSILVPFRPERRNDIRIKHWAWIKKRWEHVLPEAEIVEGTTDAVPFSKSQAVNDAFHRSSGDLLIIADADTWIERDHITAALDQASTIPHAVIPWTNCYRLNRVDSSTIHRADPAGPFPVTKKMLDRINDEPTPSPASMAMNIVIQRRSFEAVGGMDPRFLGWGGEDTSFGLACWTLLGPTVLLMGNAWSLYHARPKQGAHRVWQNDMPQRNYDLWQRYKAAKENPAEMIKLCNEHPLEGARWPIGQIKDTPELVGNPTMTETVVREPMEVDERITV